MKTTEILTRRLGAGSMEKLKALDNQPLNDIIAKAILTFQPASVFVSAGSAEDLYRVRVMAIRNGEEHPLIGEGHTVHYDGYQDQGRDPENTKFLVEDTGVLGPGLNTMKREAGLKEISQIMSGIMRGKEMIVSFYALGPVGTEFAIPCVQITDSYYVVHSEDILYRNGYDLFKASTSRKNFFSFLHSAGRLVDGVSSNVASRRMYVDLRDNTVYSANTQYAGNTVAAKKLAHRLAIRKASREGWLAEHFLITGVPSYEDKRSAYLAGAFPSWCGKTSTAMLFHVVGDDLAHVRHREGRACAVNVEKGMFGVIKDVNPEDDPHIHDILVHPGEIIFSNILDVSGRPYWQGMGLRDLPLRGCNHSGLWWKGKKDHQGRSIPISHDNARFCVSLEGLENYDATQVVDIEGIIYGGRNARRPVPVSEQYGWVHGVFFGATIESESTAATIEGSHGDIVINPMANKEFVSIPIGQYLDNYIGFGENLKAPPRIFYVNYFLKDDAGQFTNTKMDKKVWIRWMERRVHGKMDAYATPMGFIPKYDDLVHLFQKELGTDYTRKDYEYQFTIRIPELLDKLDIAEQYLQNETGGKPKALMEMAGAQRHILLEAKGNFGETISPFRFEGYPMPEVLTRPF